MGLEPGSVKGNKSEKSGSRRGVEMKGEAWSSSTPMVPPRPEASYRVAEESLAGISHCSQGVIHISLARQAADTAVQCLGHCFSHLT